MHSRSARAPGHVARGGGAIDRHQLVRDDVRGAVGKRWRREGGGCQRSSVPVDDPDPMRWFGSVLRTAQQQLTNRPDIPLETRCRPRWSVMSLAGRMIPIVDLGRWVGGLDGRKRFEDLVGVPGVPGDDPAVARLQNDYLASLCNSARPEIT